MSAPDPDVLKWLEEPQARREHADQLQRAFSQDRTMHPNDPLAQQARQAARERAAFAASHLTLSDFARALGCSREIALRAALKQGAALMVGGRWHVRVSAVQGPDLDQLNAEGRAALDRG